MNISSCAAELRRTGLVYLGSRTREADPFVDALVNECLDGAVRCGTVNANLPPNATPWLRRARQPFHYDDIYEVLGDRGARFLKVFGISRRLEQGEPAGLTALWAVSDVTVENGATELLLGSHLSLDRRRPCGERHQANLRAGECAVFIGSHVLHGVGVNRTREPRLAKFTFWWGIWRPST